jgi:hypothetical protein
MGQISSGSSRWFLTDGGVGSRRMATRVALGTAKRKRGNPNWGVPLRRCSVCLLSLKCGSSNCTSWQTPIRPRVNSAWCERNRNRVYIPEWLLGKWGITVDTTFSRPA